jgi:cytochrome c peroxidase
MPRLSIVLATLATALPLGLAGCGGAGTDTDSDSGSGSGSSSASTQAPARSDKDKDKGSPDKLVTPDTRIDIKKADSVVKGEVEGGESKAPTPLEFLVQEPDEKSIQDEPYEVAEPLGLPPLASFIPPSNPMTKGKVELGRQLYFDPRVSLDGTVSCASCHDPAKGWTDNAPTSTGIDGQVGGRSAPTVLNTAYGRTMFWDGRAPSLEGQAQGPIQNKIEMGDQSYKQIVERLRGISGYREQFRKVFGTDVTLDGMAKAIAAFERTALTGNSAFDKYSRGKPDVPETFKHLTESEKRGMVLFGLRLQDDDPFRVDSALLRKANCTACHAGDNFSDEQFHNLGVGFDEKTGQLADLGRYEISPIGAKYKAEKGAFKTPTIRDITRTAPYMHDGSEKTLEQVVEFYNKGGNKNPTLDPDMKPLNLTDQEKADLVAFMKALTGEVITVALPTLPVGPDGKSPDASKAIGMGPARTAQGVIDAHRFMATR